MQTFLVRLWRTGDETEAPTGELHGLVEGAGMAEAVVFRRDSELLAVLRSALEVTREQDVRGRREER